MYPGDKQGPTLRESLDKLIWKAVGMWASFYESPHYSEWVPTAKAAKACFFLSFPWTG